MSLEGEGSYPLRTKKAKSIYTCLTLRKFTNAKKMNKKKTVLNKIVLTAAVAVLFFAAVTAVASATHIPERKRILM